MIDPDDQNRTMDFFRQQFVEHQPPISRCFYCHAPTTQNGVGRMQVYCSNSCKQAQYRFSKNGFECKRISRKQCEIQAAELAELRQSAGLTLRNAVIGFNQ
ncbi:MAG: hypothetical protein Q8L68_01625 [Methylococcales bacterium]|nr:hypothetical protein [Methylococcales bacterium]